MFWYSLVELDSLLSLIIIIVYGLFSLRSVNIHLKDVYFFCRLFPILFVFGYYIDSCNTDITLSIDILLAILVFVIMYNFNSFESVLLLLFAFIGSYFMLHSIDLLTFYISLEAQNFAFLVLCGLQSNKDSSSFSVEAALKYFLLSAFSSGVLLFWFSTIYLQTGCSSLSFSNCLETSPLQTFSILCAMMFKLGAAPLHLWVVQIYSGVKRSLLMYISTAPKLSLFGFWVSSFNTVWTDFSVILFAVFSIVLGSFGAYSQPALRAVFAYSTVNEIGLMLLALETAGFNSLFQHLGIYIISQILVWNIDDKRLFSVVAMSLAGMPPLAGFFGKAWIFWSVINVTGEASNNALQTEQSVSNLEHLSGFNNLFIVLIIALFCAGVSLVYYLRVLRLFWNNSQGVSCRVICYNKQQSAYGSTGRTVGISTVSNYIALDSRVMLISTCVILLIFLPIFLIKPFVL